MKFNVLPKVESWFLSQLEKLLGYKGPVWVPDNVALGLYDKDVAVAQKKEIEADLQKFYTDACTWIEDFKRETGSTSVLVAVDAADVTPLSQAMADKGLMVDRITWGQDLRRFGNENVDYYIGSIHLCAVGWNTYEPNLGLFVLTQGKGEELRGQLVNRLRGPGRSVKINNEVIYFKGEYRPKEDKVLA